MRQPRRLDFVVDKLTNSIENLVSGENFETEIVRLVKDDAYLVRGGSWQFDWVKELLYADREVYKLTTRENPSVIQGLISLGERHDHVFMYLIENARFNQGKIKLYDGVAGNLVAFACKTSFERGYDGFMSFDAKSKLVQHYENTLGAKRLWGNRMFLDTPAAYKLVHKYFKDFDHA